MRKLHLVIITIFITVKVGAQSYDFTQRTASFSFLQNSTSINNGSVWSDFDMFDVPIGFTFEFMGRSFTTVTFEATGRLIFDNPDHFYYADMVTILGMRDKGATSSQSPLSYQLAGTSGNQILKIEVNNATYGGGSTVNYQIWLYEANNTIELHMGPYTSTFANTPFSGLFYVESFGPINYNYSIVLSGNPSSPTVQEFTGPDDGPFNSTLNDIPSNGTVYTFADNSILGIQEVEQSKIRLYPTPSYGIVHLTGDPIIEAKLYSTKGTQIMTIAKRTGLKQIDLSELSAGLYLAVLTNTYGQRSIKRIVKQ